jgi:hypothetical protein
MRRFAGLAMIWAIGVIAASCSPTKPSAPETGVQLNSIRYVRTLPATSPLPAYGVLLHATYPIIGDRLGRSVINGGAALRSVNDTTFVDPNPKNQYLPVDALITVWIQDDAVSPNRLGHDIYINETKISVQEAGAPYEYAVFKISKDGRVY